MLSMDNKMLSKIVVPQTIDNDSDYKNRLTESFDAYFKYISANQCFNLSPEEITCTEKICQTILKALNLYFEGRIQAATSKIEGLLGEFKKSMFIVCNLDDCYAFRMVGRIKEMQVQNHNYDFLSNSELSFFRARVSNTPLTELKEISHIPVCDRWKTNAERYSIAGIPCLYLCVSTFSCWKEADCPSNSTLYCSSIRFNEKGKSKKILNFTLPLKLLLGLDIGNDVCENQLHPDLIKMYPLVLATSFHVEHKDRKFKSEYVISQLIMHCLKKLEIDGVAYMSTKSKGEMDFPLNVCLALPVFDEQSFDNTFELTYPISLEKYLNMNNKEQYKTRSFINGYYKTKEDTIVGLSDIPYFKNSIYSAFDDYLVNQKHESVSVEEGED